MPQPIARIGQMVASREATKHRVERLFVALLAVGRYRGRRDRPGIRAVTIRPSLAVGATQ